MSKLSLSQTICLAANTAKLLGYRAYEGDTTIPFSTVYVLSPDERQNDYIVVQFVQGGNGMAELPSDTELLGHWMVRLHMEKHYGIATDHYWEK